MLCDVIGEPTKRLAYLIREPINLTGKRVLGKALGEGPSLRLQKQFNLLKSSDGWTILGQACHV